MTEITSSGVLTKQQVQEMTDNYIKDNEDLIKSMIEKKIEVGVKREINNAFSTSRYNYDKKEDFNWGTQIIVNSVKGQIQKVIDNNSSIIDVDTDVIKKRIKSQVNKQIKGIHTDLNVSF